MQGGEIVYDYYHDVAGVAQPDDGKVSLVRGRASGVIPNIRVEPDTARAIEGALIVATALSGGVSAAAKAAGPLLSKGTRQAVSATHQAIRRMRQAIRRARGGGRTTRGALPNSGPIARSLGAASRAEMFARRVGLNINSPTSRQVLNSLDMRVNDFIGQFRAGTIRREFPSEFLDRTVEEALLEGGSTVRKLLTDRRFIK